MASRSVVCGCGCGCAGCAGRDAAFAELEADRDAAVRRAEAAEHGFAAERRTREEAEARLQAAIDRNEFVEPMYGTLRVRYAELYAAHQDFLKKHGDLEAEHASLFEVHDVVKRQAARTVELESDNEALKAHAARKDAEIGRMLAVLRCHVKGQVVYPEGPNTPPSEAGAAAAATGGDGGGEEGAGAGRPQPRMRRGAAKPRRKIPGKPGGRKGHTGHGASYDPNAEIAIHKFRYKADGSLDLPRCPCNGGSCGGSCGGGGGSRGWDSAGWRTKMTRDIKVVFFDTKHVAEAAMCRCCGAEAWASDGSVPRYGACGTTLAALIVRLHDSNVKHHVIVDVLNGLKGGKVMSKSTVIAVCARGSDAHEGKSDIILGDVKASPAAGGDETQGRKAYIRLTAMVANLIWMAEYIRGALPAIVGGCARAALSVALPEEPALPAAEAEAAEEGDAGGGRRGS